jgi:predicted nuclease of predicted toxin-antitoxin system
VINKIRLYTDEHVSGAIIAGLRQRGVDVLTTPEAVMLSAIDESHLAVATSLGRVILTRDKDFLRLNARGIQPSRIVFFRQQMTIGEVIHSFMRVYQLTDASQIQNRVQFL